MYNTYPQNNTYAPQYQGYQGYAPQQPMPMAAPAAGDATAKAMLMVAGLAVVGAAAFGAVYLMNSSSQPEPTAASAPSTVVNLPSTIEIPSLNTQDDPASHVIVNNPAPVRVFTPSTPRTVNTPATVPAQSSNPTPAGTTTTDPAKVDTPKEAPKEAPVDNQALFQ